MYQEEKVQEGKREELQDISKESKTTRMVEKRIEKNEKREDNPELRPGRIPRIKEKQDKVKKEDTWKPGPDAQDKER